VLGKNFIVKSADNFSEQILKNSSENNSISLPRNLKKRKYFTQL